MANDKLFSREVILRDRRFSRYQKDFLSIVLSNPQYTIAGAEKAVEAFFGPGLQKKECD